MSGLTGVEDITRADIYGFCIPFARELMKLREESGVDVKIRLCDTMGYGVSFPGAALPRAVDKLVRAFIDDAGVPGHLLEWHGHNDFHKVVVNATTAWLYGCSAVNCAIFGFGERTGNTPIEAMVFEYLSLRGHDESIDTRAITELAEYVNTEINYHIPGNYPFVGRNFNVTRAGIHADGLVKNEEIYNIFNTDKFLNRPIEIAITDKSGKAGIAHWVNSHFKIEDSNKIDKRHPGITRMYQQIVKDFEDGRNTSMTDEELEKLTLRFIPHIFLSGFDLIKYEAQEYASQLIEKLLENEDMKSMKPKKQEPVITEFIKEYPFIQFAYVTGMDPPARRSWDCPTGGSPRSWARPSRHARTRSTPNCPDARSQTRRPVRVFGLLRNARNLRSGPNPRHSPAGFGGSARSSPAAAR